MKKRKKDILLIIGKILYIITGFILWLLLLVSVFIELKNGGSIFRSILKCKLSVPNFINLSAIGNVCESLGISSILIVWLYSSLDKTELGIRFITILKDISKYFYLYTLSHVLSILIGIWASKTVSLEIGALSLLIVFWGSGMHGYFIYKLILNSKCRKHLVENRWKSEIDNNNQTSFLKTVYSLMEVVDISNNIDTKAACHLVAIAFNKMKNKGIFNILNHYQAMWGLLLEKHDKEKQSIIVNYIFDSLSDINEEHKDICASYIIWLYRATISKATEKGNFELALLDVQLYLDNLLINSCAKSTKIFNDLYACFYIIMWLIFFEHKTNLNSWILKRGLNAKISPELKNETFVLAIAKCLEIDEKIIDVCIKQL